MASYSLSSPRLVRRMEVTPVSGNRCGLKYYTPTSELKAIIPRLRDRPCQNRLMAPKKNISMSEEIFKRRQRWRRAYKNVDQDRFLYKKIKAVQKKLTFEENVEDNNKNNCNNLPQIHIIDEYQL